MGLGLVAGAALGALGSKGGSSTSTSTPTFSKELAPLIKPAAENVAGAGPREVFGGERVAGFDPLQTQGLDMASALSANLGTTQTGVRNSFDSFAGGDFMGANPHIDRIVQAMQNSSNRNLGRNVLPGIRNTAVGSGGVGGSRQGIAEGIAMSDANRDLIDAESKLRGGLYQSDMANMLSALQNQGGILSGQSSPIDTLLAAGGMRQGLAQTNINADMDEFNENQDLPFQRQKDILSALMSGPTGQSTVTKGPDGNPLVGALGGALTMGSLGLGGTPSFGGFDWAGPGGGTHDWGKPSF